MYSSVLELMERHTHIEIQYMPREEFICLNSEALQFTSLAEWSDLGWAHLRNTLPGGWGCPRPASGVALDGRAPTPP